MSKQVVRIICSHSSKDNIEVTIEPSVYAPHEMCYILTNEHITLGDYAQEWKNKVRELEQRYSYIERGREWAIRNFRDIEMSPEEFEAFKQAWLDYPTQDNEGYVPDRGGFKCGWFAALGWKDSQKKEPSHSECIAEIKKLRESLEFVHKHLESMEGYSLVVGALYHIEESLK